MVKRLPAYKCLRMCHVAVKGKLAAVMPRLQAPPPNKQRIVRILRMTFAQQVLHT